MVGDMCPRMKYCLGSILLEILEPPSDTGNHSGSLYLEDHSEPGVKPPRKVLTAVLFPDLLICFLIFSLEVYVTLLGNINLESTVLNEICH